MNKTNNRFFAPAAVVFAMFLAVTVLTFPKAASAETYEAVSVNTVEDITADFSSVAYSTTKNLDFSQKTGKFTDTYYYQFTLDSPSYIFLKEYASLWKWNFSGNIKFYISSSQAFLEESVIDAWADGCNASYGNLYDAGTYYLKVELVFTDSKDSLDKASPFYSFSIFAQPVTRTGMTDGSSRSNAIQLKSGEYCSGIISKQTTKQYFSFRQSSDGDFKTDIVASVPAGWENSPMTVKLYNEAGAELKNSSLGGYYGNNITFSMDGLAKGSYYIEVVSDTANVHGCILNVNASYQHTAKLDAPKLKSYKAGAKKITGTAVKGSKVTVKIGKKSYTATVKKKTFTIQLDSALKKGQTIKVKATKSGYTQSKTVTYKV